MATLAETQNFLHKTQNRQTRHQKSWGRRTYPWNMDTDSTAVIRFLPDADNSNTFFWRERQIIKMTFSA